MADFTATVECRLIQCAYSTPHYMPWHREGPLPDACPFDGTAFHVDVEQSWSVRAVWDEAMRIFNERGSTEDRGTDG